MLVAYDGSPAARRALLHAAHIAGPGATLTVLNVVPVQSISARLETVSDAQRDRQRRILREAQNLLSHRGVEAHAVEAAGDPLSEIVAAATETGATIVVVGRGARTRRLIHGSVSSGLVRRATFDVLVVH